MVTVSATVVEVEDEHFIQIVTENEKIMIPISKDKPNEVKSAFNKLITLIKEGEFEIELITEDQDLFSQVAKEYITQLNREILEVRGEMEDYGLVKN